ncbi:MAG: hypothetical protein GXO07_03725 [Crenarchaeota archaeon]|nr:hypothetical protein [Thermoproteota archaeon]
MGGFIEKALKALIAVLTTHAVIMAMLPYGAPLWETTALILLSGALYAKTRRKECEALFLLYLGYFGPRLVELHGPLYEALIRADLALQGFILRALGVEVVGNVVKYGEAVATYTSACSVLRSLTFVVPLLGLSASAARKALASAVALGLTLLLNPVRVWLILAAEGFVGPVWGHLIFGSLYALLVAGAIVVAMELVVRGYLDYVLSSIYCLAGSPARRS